MEPAVRGIWFGTNSNSIFSKGTDFKRKFLLFLLFSPNNTSSEVLHHSVMNQKNHEAYDYLRKLYDFGVFLGKFNKPLIMSLKGEISKFKLRRLLNSKPYKNAANSAASIFSVVPFTFANRKTIWYLNETGLGYIPDAGASFHLSRMKGELGTYLALTGAPLFAEDLVYLFFKTSSIHDNLYHRLAGIALDKWTNESEARSHFKTRNRRAFVPLLSSETFAQNRAKDSLIAEFDQDHFDEALKNELQSRIVI